MAKVTIGGEVYEVPPLNFKGIKKSGRRSAVLPPKQAAVSQ